MRANVLRMSSGRTRQAILPALLAVVACLSSVGPVAAGTPTDRADVRIAGDGVPTSPEPEVLLPLRDTEAELLALRLLNCTRTGGWVRVDGTCKGRATGTYSPYLRPLRLHEGISSLVAFGWASELLKAQVCGHVIPGQPVLQVRLASAGFVDASFGENVGCWWGDTPPRDVVITDPSDDAGREGLRRLALAQHEEPRVPERRASAWPRWRRRTTVVYDFYGR